MGKGSRDSDSEVSLCVKYTLFFFNIIFWLIGCFIVGVSIYARTEKGFQDGFASLAYDPVMILLVVGVVIFILGFSGCVGALRENTCLLRFFGIFLGLILLAEGTVAVLIFVYQAQVKAFVEDQLRGAIKKYRDDVDLQNLIDFIQRQFRCCGVVGYKDWDANIYFNCTKSNPSREACGVPFSCCRNSTINTQCGYDVRSQGASNSVIDRIYTTGCVDNVVAFLKDNLYVVAGVAIGIGVTQLLAIMCSFRLINDIQRQMNK
ncbi:Tetraspanin-5 [Trichoplax sp. H2]|nr:Tetraspanin-5 [Trichoplax sp. H2]|eukprot:RDD47510.1 Tetraspanin-5 [Trichoplax sp. H2]